ncbi:uncharacterized protein PHA67_020557 isoform 1-T1 [Liasis olivaceus]
MTSHSGNFSTGSLTSPEASYSWRRQCSSSHSTRDEACSSPTLGEASKKNFSSSSLTGHGYHYTYPRVSVNKHLLAPVHLDIDPALQEIRTKEKEEIKTLNNQFAALIGKVQSLEQHNQVLLTRWDFLKEQDNSLSDLDIKLLYDRYMNKLNLEIRSIDVEKEHLDSELDEVLASMDVFRSKYEEEINKRSGLEFTFTTLKKDLDNGFLHKTELEAKLSGLHAWVELMTTIQEQELEEVMSQIKDVSVVLGIDNNRYMPDPHRIVEDVRAQYEDLAIKSWEELEALTRSKLNEREALSAKYGDHLLNDRRVIAELNIQIQKMRSCIVSLKSQCLQLEDNIKNVGLQGETALNDAKAKLAKLEDALHSARQDLAQLVKEYQELMNIKLALDIEILTYRKLVEGEESSMESPPPAFISKIFSRPKSFLPDSGITNVSDVASRAKDLTNEMTHSRSSLETGLSRSHNGGNKVASSNGFFSSRNNRSGGTPDCSLSTSYISEGRDIFESPSYSQRDNLGSPSRSSSNRSGNFADAEDTVESNSSRSYSYRIGSNRSHNKRSGDNLESSRYPSGEIRDISEGSLSRTQSNESGALTETAFARTYSETSDNIQEGNNSESPSHRSAEFLSSKFSRTQSGESNHSSGPRYSSRKESVPDGNQSQSQGNRDGELTDNTFARSHSGDSSEGSLFRSYSGTSASYIEGDLSRSQSDENECRNIHGNEGYAEPIVSETTRAEDGRVPVGGISGTYSEASGDISEVSLSESQSDETEFRGSHEEFAGPILHRTRSTEDGGVPVGGISESSSKASRNSSLGDQNQGSTDTVFTQAHAEGTQEDSLNNYPSNTNTAFVEGGVSRSLSGDRQSVSKGSGFRTPSIKSTTLSDSVFVRTPTSVHEEMCEESVLKIHSRARESSLETNISGDPSPRSEELLPSDLSRLHTMESRGVSDNNPSLHGCGSKSKSESGFSKNQSNRKGGLTESVFPRAHSDPAKGDYFSSQNDGSEGFVKAAISRINRGILEGGSSGSQSSRRGGFADTDLMKYQSKESKGSHEGTSFPDYGVRYASETNKAVLQSGLSKIEYEQAGSFSRNHSESGNPVETSTPIQLHRKNEEATEHSFSRSHSEASGSFKAADLLSRSSSQESRGISEANISSSCHKENEKCTEGTLFRNYSYRCAVTSHPRTESAEAEDIPESELYRSSSSESGILSSPGIYRGQSGEREDESEVAFSRD